MADERRDEDPRGHRGPVARARRFAGRRSIRWWIIAALLIAGGLEWTQTALAFLGNDGLMWYHQDFPALYAAGRLVAAGSGRLLYDTAALAQAELAAAGILSAAAAR